MVIHVEIKKASYGQTGNSNVGYRIYDYYEVGRNAIMEVQSQQEYMLRIWETRVSLGKQLRNLILE